MGFCRWMNFAGLSLVTLDLSLSVLFGISWLDLVGMLGVFLIFLSGVLGLLEGGSDGAERANDRRR